jgi:hypothetical protein
MHIDGLVNWRRYWMQGTPEPPLSQLSEDINADSSGLATRNSTFDVADGGVLIQVTGWDLL